MTSSQPSGGRDPAIEFGRYAAAALVVLLHTLPSNRRPDYPEWCAVVAMLCRVAVPFFFIVSGYFTPVAARFSAGLVVRPLVRLLPIYAFWLAVYVLVAWAINGRLPHVGPSDLITGGPAYHLWFLPALGFGLAVVAGGVPLVGRRAVVALAVPLALVCIVRGTYYGVLGLADQPGRTGLFIAPIYVLIGQELRRHGVAVPRRAALAGFAASVAVLVGEEAMIARLSGAHLLSHDFALAVFPLGISAFLLLRGAGDTWSPQLAGRARWLGGISLAVYAVHLLFLWLIPAGADLWRGDAIVARAALALLLATLLSVLLRKTPVLQRFVR